MQLNRRTNVVMDEAGVVKKFGVMPESIPDYLALVGDSRRRLSRLAGLGREIHRRGAREVQAPRRDPCRLA